MKNVILLLQKSLATVVSSTNLNPEVSQEDYTNLSSERAN